MGILVWIVFGLIAGMVAKFIMPGPDPGGIIITTLLGIGGAIVGGFIGHFLGLGHYMSFDLRSLGLAIVGALALLAGYRFLQKKA